jgi:hypothetical protein
MEGWFHKDNLRVRGSGAEARAAAIDNDMKSQISPIAPAGLKTAMQFPSDTAASDTLLRDHSDKVFTRMLDRMREHGKGVETDPSKRRYLQAAQLAEQHRAAFVEGVTRGGLSGMQELLKRGRGWSKQFAQVSTDKDTRAIADYRTRKRYLRLLAAGKETSEAKSLASGEKAKYREWVLRERLKLTDETHITRLLKDPDEYRTTVRARDPSGVVTPDS